MNINIEYSILSNEIAGESMKRDVQELLELCSEDLSVLLPPRHLLTLISCKAGPIFDVSSHSDLGDSSSKNEEITLSKLESDSLSSSS